MSPHRDERPARVPRPRPSGVHIGSTDRLAALTMQKLMPLTFRRSSVPRPARAVDPPAEVSVPTRHGPVRCLVFRPHPDAPLAGTGRRRPPLHLQVHGGGMVIRNVHEDDQICRFLASDVDCVVISIDYHAAPQVRFPVAEQECFDVLAWATRVADQHGWDASRVSVGGGSAGGKFAINMAQQAHDAGIPLRGVTLSYAIADVTCADRVSGIPKPMISPWVQRMVQRTYYVDESTRHDPLASPFFDRDLPHKLPSTLIQTADLDPLGPEMIELAGRLTKAGVDVRHTAYPSDHGFTVSGDPALIDASVREIGDFLLNALD